MYLLDTNICVYAMRGRLPQVAERIVSVGERRIGLSSITVAELAFGAVKSPRADARARVEAFVKPFRVLAWGDECVWHYGRARWHLERAGLRIGERDLLIAAHALAMDWAVVTNNTREFDRVPGLRVENWAR